MVRHPQMVLDLIGSFHFPVLCEVMCVLLVKSEGRAWSKTLASHTVTFVTRKALPAAARIIPGAIAVMTIYHRNAGARSPSPNKSTCGLWWTSLLSFSRLSRAGQSRMSTLLLSSTSQLRILSLACIVHGKTWSSYPRSNRIGDLECEGRVRGGKSLGTELVGVCSWKSLTGLFLGVLDSSSVICISCSLLTHRLSNRSPLQSCT